MERLETVPPPAWPDKRESGRRRIRAPPAPLPPSPEPESREVRGGRGFSERWLFISPLPAAGKTASPLRSCKYPADTPSRSRCQRFALTSRPRRQKQMWE